MNLLIKSVEHLFKFKIESEEEQIVKGEVYVPGAIDSQGDAMTREQIRKTMFAWMIAGRQMQIDTEHDLINNGCAAVEVYQADDHDPTYKSGSWVMTTKIFDPMLWGKVKSGELNGYSLYTDDFDQRKIERIKIIRAKRLAGTTEKSTSGYMEEHDHEVELELSDNGKVVPTKTKKRQGHCHKVTKLTATEEESGHSHRLIY